MNKRLRCAVVAALLSPLAAFGGGDQTGPYVTEAMIQQSNVQFSLLRIGTFRIESVEHATGEAPCQVSLQSVADMVAEGVATGDFELAKGARNTVKLKKFVLSSTLVKCYGPGRGCKVTVVVSEVDPEAVNSL